MTHDRPLSDADLPDLTPEEEERVRRLLAGARETGPMPADVAARLDDVLADLRATATPVSAASAGVAADGSTDASADGGSKPPVRGAVVPISRWRRRVAGGLVAAAAVVLGVAVVPQLTLSGDDGGDATTASSGESREEADGGASDRAYAPEAAPSDSGAPETMTEKSLAGADLALISRAELRRTARDLRSPDADRFKGPAAAPCGTPADDAQVVTVTYAGADALLVYSPPANGRQRVELWTCPGPEVIETIHLPAP